MTQYNGCHLITSILHLTLSPFHHKLTQTTKAKLRLIINPTTTPQPITLAFFNSINNIPFARSTNHLSNAKQHKPPKQARYQSTHHLCYKSTNLCGKLSTHGTILTITEGSNIDFSNKRQWRDYYRQVNHVAIKDPTTKTKWSHIPITFSAQDINFASFPHTDAMVVIVHIDRWDVTRILVNNGSQAEILFLLVLKNGL
jgi:hypothetical protein